MDRNWERQRPRVRQRERERDRQTDRQRNGQTNRETKRHGENEKNIEIKKERGWERVIFCQAGLRTKEPFVYSQRSTHWNSTFLELFFKIEGVTEEAFKFLGQCREMKRHSA
jgi:hypothetical protein